MKEDLLRSGGDMLPLLRLRGILNCWGAHFKPSNFTVGLNFRPWILCATVHLALMVVTQLINTLQNTVCIKYLCVCVCVGSILPQVMAYLRGVRHKCWHSSSTSLLLLPPCFLYLIVHLYIKLTQHLLSFQWRLTLAECNDRDNEVLTL